MTQNITDKAPLPLFRKLIDTDCLVSKSQKSYLRDFAHEPKSPPTQTQSIAKTGPGVCTSLMTKNHSRFTINCSTSIEGKVTPEDPLLKGKGIIEVA